MSREKALYSIEAEQALLGAILIDNAVLDRVGHIREEDFYLGTNRIVYRAIRLLIRDGLAADVVSTATKLQSMGDLEHLGGLPYIGELAQAATSVAAAPAYAKIVVDRSLDRQLLDASGEIAEIAHGLDPVEQRVDRAQSLVMALSERGSRGGPVLVATLLPEMLDEIERRAESRGAITGLETSLIDLDRRLNGMQRGDLIVVAGRPSMGKTSLSLQMAAHLAVGGKVALYFSQEMSRHQIVEKAAANVGRLELEKIRKGDLGGDDYSRLSLAMGKLSEARLVVDDAPALTVEQLRARARGVKRQHGLDAIFIDYLQLMSADGDNRNDAISTISRGLKSIARELDVPVIALSQLNRALEQRANKRPVMADLRDSGAIEQDADVIVFIYRDEVYNPHTQDVGMAELDVAKQRMGPTGVVGARWMPEYGAFANADWRPHPKAPKPETKRSVRTHDETF